MPPARMQGQGCLPLPSTLELHRILSFLLLVLFFHPSLRFSVAATLPTNSSVTSTLLAFKEVLSPKPNDFLSRWNTSAPDYCSWPGVLCSANTSNVVGLLLDSQQFNGSISPQLGDLPHLAYLNLSGNGLTGPIPPQLGKLVALTHFDLNSNFLTGPVPSSLANCTRLQYIDLSKNSLAGAFPSYLPSFTSLVFFDLSANREIEGQLPADIGLLSNLQFFHMYGGSITGHIPPSITNCSNLAWLALSDNQLSGEIPQDWNNLPSLEHLNLYDNVNLGGNLPLSLANCTMLVQLDLQNNSLTGEIPEAYGKLRELSDLKLYYNGLSGIIPRSIGNLTSLIDFEVAYNNLSGSIPREIGKLRQLQWLSLTGNPNLAGSIPDSIGNCAQLDYLTLGKTGLSGNLPKSLFNLTSLEVLSADSSRFSGTLSEDIGKLSSLSRLQLNFNAFYGPIPKGLGQLKSLQGLYLSGNNFTGLIPDELADCAGLAVLDLSGNSLSGPIPSSLGRLEYLNDLHLHDNRLVGNIPESLGDLKRLENVTLGNNMLTGSLPYTLANLHGINKQLDLSFNRLAGTIPSQLGGMTMVLIINLAGNNFTGSIPGTLGDCIALQVLNLSVNRLEGVIPEALGDLISLQKLDLSYNNLSGELPSSLGRLPELSFLNVSFNQVQGQIPAIGVYKNASLKTFLGNPGLCGAPLPECESVSSHTTNDKKVLSIAIGSAAGGIFFVLLVCVLYWVYCKRGCGKSCAPLLVPGECEDDSFDLEKPRFKAWTAKELRDLTNNFDVSYAIGTGSVSVCYKVTTDALKEKPIAIKKLNLSDCTGREARRSFISEVKTLCKMRHRNLVKVLGYCVDGGVIALVLEFMENGTADEHIHGGGERLSLDERLNVAVGVAEGLVYLHHEYGPTVIHCDLKPKNILLGADMVAKIADFGIARLLDGNHITDETVSAFRGTIGYAAPEYAGGFRISTSADVYSYGVLLAELVTGVRPTSERIQEESAVSLMHWVRSAYDSGRTEDVVDMELKKNAAAVRVMKEAEQVLRIALECTKETARERPTMKVVRDMVLGVRKHKTVDNERPYPEVDELLQAKDVSLLPADDWLSDHNLRLE